MTGELTESIVERAFREDRAAVLPTVIRYVGDFEVAEEAVQDAFVSAVASWPRDGVPDSPRAWLVTAARRRAVDRIRRSRTDAKTGAAVGGVRAAGRRAGDRRRRGRG
jgi:RNA polymerase sigma-70 factor (ECF subfamily)